MRATAFPKSLFFNLSIPISAVQVYVCTPLAFHQYYVSFKYIALEFIQGCLMYVCMVGCFENVQLRLSPKKVKGS